MHPFVQRAAFAIGGACMLAALAQAQDVAAPKLYRWVGADGKAHYSDTLPPEALNKARDEISVNSGMTLKKVDRALTGEEKAAVDAKVAADAKVAKAMEDAKQNDTVLLASYPTARELRRAYDERTILQNETVKATRVGMQSQQQSLSTMLSAASNRELNGKPVDAKLAESILTTRQQLHDQQTLLVQHIAQGAALQAEYQSMLQRWTKLRNAEAAKEPAPSAPAESSTPNS